MSIVSDALFGHRPDGRLLDAQTFTMTPQMIQDLLSRAGGYADQTVTTGPALAEALRQRMSVTGDQMAEQFNMRGQSPQAGVFQEALGRALNRSTAEAELQQQMARSAAMQNYFGQTYQGAENQGMFNAQQQQNANTAHYVDQSGRRDSSMANAGQVAGGVMSMLGGPIGQSIYNSTFGNNATQDAYDNNTIMQDRAGVSNGQPTGTNAAAMRRYTNPNAPSWANRYSQGGAGARSGM